MPSVNDQRPPTLAELHVQLLSESKDPQWGYEAEQSIRHAIAQANTTGEFDVPTVECRQSICEVLAFGNLPDSGNKWNQLWDGLTKQPWYSEFKNNSTSISASNGRFTIVTIVQRKRK